MSKQSSLGFTPKTVEKSRNPEDFEVTKKLYIVGVPIDYTLEESSRIQEFKNILIRAKKDKWLVYITASPSYFHDLNLDGWKTVEELGVDIQDISPLWDAEGKRSANRICEHIAQVVNSSDKPLVLLRPGSPYVGDIPAMKLYERFKDKAEILDAKSGPDIVADIAESKLGLNCAERVHLAGFQVLDLDSADALIGKVILIRSLDPLYKYGDTSYFDAVLEKLESFGLGNKLAFIKGPRTEGEIVRVHDLRDNIQQYDPTKHYTIVLKV